jgi:hypothetical protein
MNKIKYLLRVFRKMSFKKMFSTINEINKRTNKSKIYLFFDIINCALRYQSGYVDYLLFEMWNLNHKERETVLTRGKNNIFVKYYNDNKNYGHTFLNKNEFNEKFNKYLNREYIILNKNEDEFNKFIKGKKQIFCKPINGTHGDNMEKISPKEFKGNLYEYLLSKNLKLVEEVVIQCDEMNKLYPYAINTVRIITVHRYDGKVKLVAAYQRIGNHGYIVDNYNGGGMVVPIEEDGTIKYPAVDKLKNVYYEHPMTNTKIVGFKVPMYKEALDLAMKASKIIKEVRYVGWDIAITKKGPTIIEGNEYPGHDIYQLPVHRENNIGVLPKFESALGKIKDLKK